MKRRKQTLIDDAGKLYVHKEAESRILKGLRLCEAMTEIRRLSLPWWEDGELKR